MTLPSHKNHPTTLQNIRLSKHISCCLGVALVFGALIVPAANAQQFDRPARPDAFERRMLRIQKAELAPSLDGLKRRSAKSRWSRLKNAIKHQNRWKKTSTRQDAQLQQLSNETLEPTLLGRHTALAIPQEPPTSDDLLEGEETDSNAFDDDFDSDTEEDSSLYAQDKPLDSRRIDQILPYFDYEPDPDVAKDDPCRYLCPRPEGCPPSSESASSRCPEVVDLSDEVYTGRHFGESVFTWEASDITYNPLYFEDAPLERYGHTYPCLIQPVASISRFHRQLVGLPYQMVIDPMWKKISPLGWYRPGEHAPKLFYQTPLNVNAATAEAGVLTGLFFLIP